MASRESSRISLLQICVRNPTWTLPWGTILFRKQSTWNIIGGNYFLEMENGILVFSGSMAWRNGLREILWKLFVGTQGIPSKKPPRSYFLHSMAWRQ